MNKLLCLLGLLLVASCTDTNTVINPGEKPVINAYLAAGKPVSMKVYTEIPYAENSDGKSVGIDGLTIRIKSGEGRTYTLTGKGNGLYESAADERIGGAGTTYSLTFEYKGRTISATTTIPAKPVGYKLSKTQISRRGIDLSGGGFPSFGSEDNTAIDATWQNPDKAYFYLAVINIEATPREIIKLPDGASLPTNRFTTQPVTSDNTSLIPRSFSYFGLHNVILFRVNPDYAELYRSGGTSTQNLSTPPTAITNGLGIFTGINADTLQLRVNRL
jgi:hypothetical protein